MTAIFPEKFKYIDPRQVEAYLITLAWMTLNKRNAIAPQQTVVNF
jgi:hypothetical protein